MRSPRLLRRFRAASVLAGLGLAVLASLSACSGRAGTLKASGIVEATEVRVSSKSSGEILELRAAEGDSVSAGAVLAQIDKEGLELQRDQAKAGVDYADAQLRLLLKGAREEDLAQANEALNQASENRKAARLDADRVLDLYAKGSATAKQKDDASTRLALADAQYSSAEQALKKLSNLARPEEISAAKAKLDQAVYAFKLLEKAVRDCTVLAPVGGVVSSRPAERGELAAPGTPLFVLSDLSTLRLTIYVPEDRIAGVRLGQQARVRVDGVKEAAAGKVSYVSERAEFTPKNVQTADERAKQVFAVRVSLPGSSGSVKPGMSADAELDLE